MGSYICSGCNTSLHIHGNNVDHWISANTRQKPVQIRAADGHRLWQDNDTKHSSRSTKEWFESHDIKHCPTHPESPVRSVLNF